MRKDIAKVITERERRGGYGSTGRERKGYKKALERAMGPSVAGRSIVELDANPPPAAYGGLEIMADEWDDYEDIEASREFDLPRRESIKKRSGGTKEFTDVLGALEGWVRKQIGRPGSKVLAEISANLPATGGVSLTHARGHLFEFLLTECFYCDGILCHTYYGGGPMPVHGSYRAVAYIDPADGIVKRVKLEPSLRRYFQRPYGTRPGEPRLPTRRWIDGRMFASINEVWYEYTLGEAKYAVVRKAEKLTHSKRTHYFAMHVYEGQFDVYLGTPVEHNNEHERKRIYRGNKYASARRQLNSREIKKLGLAAKPESQKPNLWRKKKPRGRRG